MDPITLIVTALAAGSGEGAFEALKDDVTDAIKSAYATLRGLVRTRVCDQPGAELVLARYEDDPGIWGTPLARMLHDTGAAVDVDLLAVAHALLELVDAVGAAEGKYDVTITDSQGVQVGDQNVQVNRFGA
jgi:RIP homotypic interaction motif